ncbi:MAG: MFS transporter [Candidatus Atribacteria bacterium]|nr:MFS transporter [Candidatus Atribacteria bacterium]
MELRKWFFSFALQGASLSLFNIVVSLYVILGLNGNVQGASIAVALFSLGNLIGSISSGIILDRIKKVSTLIYICFFASSVIMILMGFTKVLYLYYIFAVLLGTLISFTGPAMTLHLTKLGEEGFVRRQVNTLNLFNSVGSTIGMLFGSVMLSLIHNLNDVLKLKLILLIASLMLLVSSLLVMEKGRRRIVVRPDIRATRILFTRIVDFTGEFFKFVDVRNLDRSMRLITTAVFVTFFGANIVLSIFTVFLKETFKMSSQLIFLIYAANSFAGNIAFFMVGRLKTTKYDKLFIRLVIFARGIIFALFGLLTLLKLPFIKSFIIVGFVFIGFTWPFLYIPLTLEITKLAPQRSRGRALGIFNMSINSAVILASFVAGIIALHFGYVIAFLIGGGLMIVGGLIFHKSLNR